VWQYHQYEHVYLANAGRKQRVWSFYVQGCSLLRDVIILTESTVHVAARQLF